MKALLVWLIMLFTFFVVHVVVWRKWPVYQNKKNLLIIMGVVFLTIALYRLSFFEFLLVGFSYFSVCGGYFIFYLWLEWDSPSLHFIELLAQHPNEQVSVETIKSHFIENNPITGRLEMLVEEGFCVYEPPNYRLTQAGRQIANFFAGMSRVFGMSLEG